LDHIVKKHYVYRGVKANGMFGLGMVSISDCSKWVVLKERNTDTAAAPGSNRAQLLDISLQVEKIGARGPASRNEELL